MTAACFFSPLSKSYQKEKEPQENDFFDCVVGRDNI